MGLCFITGCGSGAVTSPPADHLGCTVDVTGVETAVAGDAAAPLCMGEEWVFDIPAQSSPPSTRRTEVFITADGKQVTGRPGTTVVEDMVIRGVLGESGQGDKAWHTIWQLQGPTGGEWLPPPVGLQIRGGTLYLGGGAGYPGGPQQPSNYEWRKALSPFRDDTPIHVRVTTVLSPDPAVGVVSVAIDGRTVLDRWHPESSTGLRPSTLYPGQDAVVSRVGLYRGSQGESAPQYRQMMSIQLKESTVD